MQKEYQIRKDKENYVVTRSRYIGEATITLFHSYYLSENESIITHFFWIVISDKDRIIHWDGDVEIDIIKMILPKLTEIKLQKIQCPFQLFSGQYSERRIVNDNPPTTNGIN